MDKQVFRRGKTGNVPPFPPIRSQPLNRDVEAGVVPAHSGGRFGPTDWAPRPLRAALECGSLLPLSLQPACWRPVDSNPAFRRATGKVSKSREQARGEESGSKLPHSKAPRARTGSAEGQGWEPSPAGIRVKISVAYGNQLAGVGGVELSLGEIAQSGNTICGRRADSRVNLAGVASAAQYWLFGRNRRTDPLPRATCRLFLCESDYVHEKKYCYG